MTFITPAAAGNSPDVVTRIVADKLSQMWKQQIVVLNRPGAGGLIAAQAAAASNIEKDGYTLYMTQASTCTVLPIQQEGKMPVDLQKAFAPVGMVGEQPIAVAVNKDVPANSVKELIDARQQDQGRHAVRRHQPRRPGASDRRTVPRPLQGQHLVRPRRRRGRVAQRRDRRPHPDHVRGPRRPRARHCRAAASRLLGVAAQKRLPNLPNLPAINETVPGVVSSGWIVLMAPAGVPDAIIQKLNADLRKVVAMPDVIERFHTLGTYSRDYTPAQTGEFMRSEEKLWWPIVRQVNKEQAK